MEKILITGGAGFIGSHLARLLLEKGHEVVCVDSFELGQQENVEKLMDNPRFHLIKMDISDVKGFGRLLAENGTERIFHLAANSDIQKSAQMPEVDYKNTFLTTYSVLEGMRQNNIRKLFFASTSAVYGDKEGKNISEDVGDLHPISYYGGAKLASEAFISSYAYMNDLEVLIFRFPNVIGPNLTHGVIFDFIHKLQKNPRELEILGDGTQCKPYLYVADLVEAIAEYSFRQGKGVEIFNIGVDSATTVHEIADMICVHMKLKNVQYHYTGGNVGWKGDVPTFQYDLSKIYATGWRAAHNSNESVQATLDNLKL